MTDNLRQRQPRIQDKAHCAFIRRLPCLITGRTDGVECAHIRYADLRFDKRETGKAERPSDQWTVPLHHELHRAQHATGERDWWRLQGINPITICLALYEVSGDDEAGKEILREARERNSH